jgi:hypothetical protein
VDLENLVSYSVKESTWFTYPDSNFKVHLNWIKTSRIAELGKKATVTVCNKETKFRKAPQYSEQLFSELFSQEAIKAWTGLTVELLRKLLPGADISDSEGEIPCTDRNKAWLMSNSLEFSNWVTTLATEVEEHKRAQKEAEQENLGK